MTAKTTTRTAAARADLAERTATTEGWRAALERAEAALVQVEAAQPTTPDEVAALAAQRVTDRETVALARQALDTAQTAEDAARRAAVAAEGEDMAPAIAAAQKAAAAHQRRTRDLLADLAAHTGGRAECWRIPGFGPGGPAEANLLADLRHLEATQRALVVASDGGDPTTVLPLAELPASLQVGGVLPCTAAREQAARDAEADRWQQILAAEQVELDEAAAVLGLPAEEPALESHRLPESRASEFWEKYLGGTTTAQADALLTIARLAGPGRAIENCRQLMEPVGR